MWHSFFDKIFLISLDHLKTDNFRLPTAKGELDRFEIPYEVYSAIKRDNGAYGCFLTYQHLFDNCIAAGYKNILVFEDDIKFILHPDSLMNEIVNILPADYHTLHFGPNTHCSLTWHNRPTLLTMNQCRSTHAQGYSLEAMRQIASYPWTGMTIDQRMEEYLQPQGRCFCTYPLLVTQRNGYSDIDKREVNMHYIQERFENNTKHLR